MRAPLVLLLSLTACGGPAERLEGIWESDVVLYDGQPVVHDMSIHDQDVEMTILVYEGDPDVDAPEEGFPFEPLTLEGTWEELFNYQFTLSAVSGDGAEIQMGCDNGPQLNGFDSIDCEYTPDPFGSPRWGAPTWLRIHEPD